MTAERAGRTSFASPVGRDVGEGDAGKLLQELDMAVELAALDRVDGDEQDLDLGGRDEVIQGGGDGG